MTARRLIISGLVQGVYYRAAVKVKADELGLTGFVKNLDDGGVEIFAEGPDEKLKELEEWCWKGPPKAAVKNVTMKEDQEKGLETFDVWY